jgi:hypothetical protein
MFLKAMLRIRNVYPGSCFSPIPDPEPRISDPGSNNNKKEKRIKIFFVLPFSVAINFTKPIKLSEIWDREPDPRSGIRRTLLPDPDPGVKKHRVPNPDPQHCWKAKNLFVEGFHSCCYIQNFRF